MSFVLLYNYFTNFMNTIFSCIIDTELFDHPINNQNINNIEPIVEYNSRLNNTLIVDNGIIMEIIDKNTIKPVEIIEKDTTEIAEIVEKDTTKIAEIVEKDTTEIAEIVDKNIIETAEFIYINTIESAGNIDIDNSTNEDNKNINSKYIINNPICNNIIDCSNSEDVDDSPIICNRHLALNIENNITNNCNDSHKSSSENNRIIYDRYREYSSEYSNISDDEYKFKMLKFDNTNYDTDITCSDTEFNKLPIKYKKKIHSSYNLNKNIDNSYTIKHRKLLKSFINKLDN